MYLPSHDLHAIARSVAGLQTWRELQTSPVTTALLNTLTGMELIKQFPPDVQLAILAVDPSKPPPTNTSRKEVEVSIPALPPAAELSKDAQAQASFVGTWLDDVLDWSKHRSPMTPENFLLAGALFSLGLAIARRACVHIHGPVYPHFYILWVARTSVYRKTTGLSAIYDLIAKSMPHMLFPEELTPEAFILTAAGNRPANYDNMSAYARKNVDIGVLHAAQRGLVLDEASGLFAQGKKDYMAGSEEMWLRGFDAPAMYSRETKNDGRMIINSLAFSLLGATTPAAFIRSVPGDGWDTGLTARFLLCFPESRLPYSSGRLAPKEYAPPDDLVKRLRNLHKALPLPEQTKAIESSELPPNLPTLYAIIDQDVFAPLAAYSQALTYDLIWDGNLDSRLHGNYSRLPVYTQKIMLALAAIDWADQGHKGEIRITLGHYARAQQITELFRASLHRLVAGLSQTREAEQEDQILAHLERFPEGETERDLLRRTGLPRKSIQEAIASLIEAGLIHTELSDNKAGRKTTLYKVTENTSVK